MIANTQRHNLDKSFSWPSRLPKRMNTSTVPLQEALPWSPSTPDCVLVTDCIETDGRFLLFTIATGALSRQESVLWLSCGAQTTSMIASALRKLGNAEATAPFLKRATTTTTTDDDSGWSEERSLHIHSIMADLSNATVAPDSTYLQDLSTRIQGILANRKSTTLVVIDDVSALHHMFGKPATYLFLSQLLGMSKLILKCSNEQFESARQWIGSTHSPPAITNFEGMSSLLVELASWVVDVVPLTSGYSREAHGRLVMTNRTTYSKPVVMNYCLQDTSVAAILLKPK